MDATAPRTPLRSLESAALGTGLACAALEPALGGVLLFDAPASTVFAAAGHLAALLGALHPGEVEIVTLGAADAEESLWGGLSLDRDAGELRLAWKPGRLTQAAGAPPRVVAVPDLAHLSLAAARAAVALLGADVAALQRHGQNLQWAPDLRWVAGCARAEVGEVSPHLLDRFPLRLSTPPAAGRDRAGDIDAWLRDPAAAAARVHLPGPSAADVQAGHRRPWPAIPSSTLHYLLGFVPPGAAPGARRDLAFARLCRTLARLDGWPQVTPRHVDEAAALVGLRHPERAHAPATPAQPVHASQAGARTPTPDAFTPTAGEGTAGSAADPGAPAAGAAAAEVDGSAERPVVEPDAETAFPAAALALEPYPEDAEATVGETASLQPAVQHRQADAAAEGPVTGTRPATDLRDVAWVSTVLEGARYRRVRPPPEDPSRPFAITRADLRSYRRAPVPQQMLLLVMDYTALEGVDWQEALIPHLGWAYAERASVGIVRVGSSGAANPLRADRVMARSILGPDVSAALREQPGMATPLAHGLELAAQTLQGEIQRGRSGVKRARLVVLTDGRGNVPLAASRAGALSGPVFRHGIDDALHEARVLGGMAHVETHLLNPCPRLYPDVPLALADALRAWVEDIPAAAEEPSS